MNSNLELSGCTVHCTHVYIYTGKEGENEPPLAARAEAFTHSISTLLSPYYVTTRVNFNSGYYIHVGSNLMLDARFVETLLPARRSNR